MKSSTKRNTGNRSGSRRSNTNRGNTNTSMMEGSSNDPSSLREYFIKELRDIYWAEKHLVKALPKMEKAATTEELKDAIREHQEVTERQVQRLEDVFEMMGERPVAKKCEAIEGITSEGEQTVNELEKGTLTRDVAVIVAAQKVEHYEIATYGGLAQIAHTLGESEVADVLEEILDEEKEADRMLSDLAEEHINEEAMMEA